MPSWSYPLALALISVFAIVVERLWPARRDQEALRPGLASDAAHLVFNGHLLGVILFGLATRYVAPPLDAALESAGLAGLVYRDAASGWHVALQIVVALLVIDFVQWGVHNLLHRVPALWELHKCHHSVEDGEMDWIVSFRFQWTEVVVYRAFMYLPLAWFGFGETAIFVHAVFGTLIGHLNHANVAWDYGPLRYVLNNPRMHLWHHDYDGDAKTTVNFGIIFSCWDWIFGTAKLPDEPPARIGFAGVETYPKNFFAAETWFVPGWLNARVPVPVAATGGALLVAIGLWAVGWSPFG